MLAALAKFGEIIGRIIFCQVAFRGGFDRIEKINNTTSSFVRNECSGYRGGLTHYQLGFLVYEVVFLLVIGISLLGGMLSSRELVSQPLQRYNDRICHKTKGEEA